MAINPSLTSYLNKLPGPILAASAAALWGTVSVSVKYLYAIDATNPVTVGFLRLVISVPFFYGFERCFTERSPLYSFVDLKRKQILIVLAASIAIAIYQLFLFASITYTQVSTAIIIDIGSAPVMAALLSWPLLSEKPTLTIWFCIIAAVFGVGLVSGIQSMEGLYSGSSWGNILALLAGFTYAIYSILTRLLMKGGMSPWQVVHTTSFGGCVFLVPFVFHTGLEYPVSAFGWMIILYLALIPTAIAYVLWTFALKTTLASVATTMALLEPLTATLLAVLLLNEQLTSLQLIGAALLLASMYKISTQ